MSFTNAKIVAVSADSREYHAKTDARGTSGFHMSSSALRAFAACPSKWKAGWELPPSSSLEYGSLFDTLVLTPEQFAERYVVTPSHYETTGMQCSKCKSVTDSKKCAGCKRDRAEVKIQKEWNANSDTCREWSEAQRKAGREIVSREHLAEAQAAVKRLNEDHLIRLLLADCETQVWIEADWLDDATGLLIPCKCLIDFVTREDSEFHKSIGDLKTTKSAAVQAWEKWAHIAGYDIQAAWNTDIFVAATGREITEFRFILSENSHPWQPARRMMCQDLIDPQGDTGDIASGRRQYQALMAGYAACVKSGNWPGYDDTDESTAGWTIVQPNPYDEQRRAFAPKYQFAGVEAEPAEAEPSTDFLNP